MVSVPALTVCITQGDNIEEAMVMAQEAIEIYIEELQARGEKIPDNSNSLKYSLNLETA